MTYESQLASIGAALDEEFAKIAAQLEPEIPPVDPEPEPEPPAQGSGLPDRVMYNWHHCWKGPLPWSGYPADVRSKLNFSVLGLAQSAGAGTGKLGYFNKFGTTLKTAVTDASANGRRTVMGFGGSSDGGITIQNDTQVQEAFDSFVRFVGDYGISGMDIDLEPSGSKWSESYLVKLVKKLKAKYPDWIVGITPGLYGEHTAKWMSLARALGNDYDYMAPMLYDFWEAGTYSLTNVALDKCRLMREGGVPEHKMILGFMTMPDPNYKDPQGRPKASTVEITQAAWDACKRSYPSIRGVFHWEDSIDAAHTWAWSRQFKL